MKNAALKTILALAALAAGCGNRTDLNRYSHGALKEARPEAVGMSAERLSRIDRVFKEYVDNRWMPGAVALVARRGRVVFHKAAGFSDVEAGKPMEKDAIFRIASMTKAVTSVAAMMLYEEGGFLLDDPVSGLIPEFKNPRILVKTRARDSSFTSRPAKREITVRHLLNQTSGIGYGNSHPDLKPLYDKARIPDGIVTTDAVLGDKMKALAKLPLLHEPGEKWTYGLNTDVLGYLIETISGKTLQDFFQERIFTPLGMTDTYFFIPEDKADRLVPLYEEPETGVIRKSSVTAFNYPVEGGKNYYSGGGGLCSTARDYAKFLQALLNGGEYNGARLLGRKTLDLMTLNQADGYWEKNTFGLGFGMTDQRGVSEKPCSVGNYWWSGYFGTSFWVDPEEELVGVLMLQVSPARHGEIHQKFEVLTYQSIID